MGVVDFDIKRVKRVNIEDVIQYVESKKQTQKSTKKYQIACLKRVYVESLLYVNRILTQEGKYEIIDGQQRYTFAKELATSKCLFRMKAT